MFEAHFIDKVMKYDAGRVQKKTVIYHLLMYFRATICNFTLDLESLYPLFTAEPSLSNVHQASLLERRFCHSSKMDLIAMAEMLREGQCWGYGWEARNNVKSSDELWL